jgi:outer membrane protein
VRTTSLKQRFLLATAAVAFAAASVAIAPATLAADITDVGYVDQSALAGIPAFVAANRQVASYKSDLDRQFAAQIKSVRDPGQQQRIAQEFQNKLTDRQRAVFGPLFHRAQVAIASVASSKNLSVIVDKRIIIFGGQDVTKNVIDLVTGIGDPVPPVNTPPPSTVGFVDQTAIDQVPKLKSANDDFQKFRADQQQAAQEKMKSAKTDADRQAILADFQKSVGDRQKSVLDPLVDQTRGVIADIAKKKNLLLVIDRGNIIFGGTDITADVASALK